MRVAGPREENESRYGIVPDIGGNVTSLPVRARKTRMWLLTEPGRSCGWEAIPNARLTMRMCTLRVLSMSEFYYCSYVTG